MIDHDAEHRLYVPMDPYLFYELGGGYALNKGPHALPDDAVLKVGPAIPLSCMFDCYWLLHEGQKVGYYFRSTFQVLNDGGYVCAYMGAARGAADRVEILLNTEELVVFHYPGKGTMIISPHVGTELTQIFTEQ
jgi:hypothetical protein